MVDTSRLGQRFVIKPGVRTFAGNYHGQHGTILAEYPNGVGQQIIRVHIDGVGEAVLLAKDIEMVVETV